MRAALTFLTLPLALVLALAAAPSPARAQEPSLDLEAFSAHPPMAEVLLIGTFHFRDAGHDGYRPEVDVDILAADRQQELREVLDRISERFAPTKIALEADGEWAARMTASEYPAYLRGELVDLGPNEVYQVGFRLGRELGHRQLHYIDADGRYYPGIPYNVFAYAREYAEEHGQESLLESPWEERYTALYRHGDLAKATETLRETWLRMNDPERVMATHGHYLLGRIALGDQEEYPGADLVTGWWFNRNLRIFANVRRIAEPGDRILVLIGAGHLPILRQSFDASPEFELIEVADILDE